MSGIIYTPAPTPPTPPTPPGAPDRGLQYNASGTFGGLALLSSDTNGDLAQYIATSTPSPAPPQNNAILYADGADGDEPISQINSWGKAFPVQNNIGHKIIGMAWPGAGTSVVAAFAWTGVVNSSQGTWNNTNPLANKTYSASQALPNYSKQNGASAAAINSSVECYTNSNLRAAIVGSAKQSWGTKLIITFGLPTYKTDQRIFAGYSQASSILPQNTDPSTNLNCVAVIKDQGDSTFNFYVRGATGGTKFNTGITPTLNGVYRVTIFIPSEGTAVYLNFQEIGVNTITSSSYSNNSTIPIPGTYLYAHLQANTGATTSNVVNLSFIQMYEEQL